MLSLKKREKSVDFFLVLFTLGRLGSGASSIFTQLRFKFAVGGEMLKTAWVHDNFNNRFITFYLQPRRP